VETLARSPARSCLLLLLIASATLLFRLGGLPLCGSDEPRYARIAEEMLARDRWITPVLEGRPWLEKPPLYYWLTMPLFATLGVGETTARLAPALCGLACALTVFWLGRRLGAPLGGFYGAAILLTSIGFVGFARSASTDMPLTACLTLALSVLCARIVDPVTPSWSLLCAYGVLGLAVLAKGPVALVLAAGTCVLFWWLDERGGSLRKWRMGAGLLTVAAVSLPWFFLVFRENGFAFVSFFFVNHNLVRYVSGIHHHSETFFYYVPMFLALFFPWSGWMALFLAPRPMGRWYAVQEWNPATLFLTCWAVFPLLFFSLSQSKLPGYILPSLPPMSLLLGRKLQDLANRSPANPGAAAWTYLLICAGVAGALPLFFNVSYGGRWKAGLALSSCVLGPGVWAFLQGRMGKIETAMRCTILQGLLVIMGVGWLAFPVLGDYHSTRTIARQALADRLKLEPIITYRFFHHSLLYYTGYQVAGYLQTEKELKQFALRNPSFLVVTQGFRFEELQKLQGFSVSILGSQGKLRLFRISHR